MMLFPLYALAPPIATARLRRTRSIWLKLNPWTESQIKKRVKQISKSQSRLLFHLKSKYNHPHQKSGTLYQVIFACSHKWYVNVFGYQRLIHLV